jgi:hypothetical protein
MMIPADIEKIITTLQQDFDAIQMPRTSFMLQKMVVEAHDHPAQAWAQCVLELQVKYDAIRRAKIRREILLLEISRLEGSGDEIDKLHAAEKQIDIEEQDRAMLGAAREFESLYQLYTSFGRRYSRHELDAAQPEYWQRRLTRQANQDLLATGHVSQSNQDGLRQIGAAWPGQNQQIEATQTRDLSRGNRRLLVVVATENKAESGLPCVEGLHFPAGVECRVHNIYGLPTAEAYNEAGLTAMRDGADWLFTVEDDTFPPPDALVRLVNHNLDVVGAWYPKRETPRTGVPIILKNGARQGLDDPDGSLREVYTIPQGCTLVRTDVLRTLPYPWFVTTPQLSQDSYFSQLAREAGVSLWCDTSIMCRHIDRVDGTVYV